MTLKERIERINGGITLMTLKERIKAALAHKHDWKEDQWGKRCQTCGAIHTKKQDRIDTILRAGFDRFLLCVQLGLGIAVIILLIKYPLTDKIVEHARDQMLVILGPHYWTFFYILIMFLCMIIRHLLGRGESERG